MIACGSQDRFVYLWSTSDKSMSRLGSDSQISGHLHEVNDVCSRDTLLSHAVELFILGIPWAHI